MQIPFAYIPPQGKKTNSGNFTDYISVICEDYKSCEWTSSILGWKKNKEINKLKHSPLLCKNVNIKEQEN